MIQDYVTRYIKFHLLPLKGPIHPAKEEDLTKEHELALLKK